MAIVDPPTRDDAAELSDQLVPEALFPEAREVQRLRWRRRSLLAAVAGLGCLILGAGLYVLVVGRLGATAAADGARANAGAVTVVQPKQPTSLSSRSAMTPWFRS